MKKKKTGRNAQNGIQALPHANKAAAGSYRIRAATVHQAGRFAEAEMLYRAAYKHDSLDTQTAHNIGITLYQQGRLQEAVVAVRLSIDMSPNNPDNLSNYGLILHAAGLLEEAVTAYKQSLLFAPGNAATLNNLGNVYSELGSHEDEASKAYYMALTLLPTYTEAYNNLGSLYNKLQKYQLAIEQFDAALAIGPGMHQAHYNRGNSLTLMSRYKEAQCAYITAIELDATSAQYYGALGHAYHKDKNLKDAIECYRKCLELNPADAATHSNLGLLYVTLRSYATAKQHLQNAVALATCNPEYHLNLGTLYRDTDDFEAGVSCCTKALSLLPSNPLAYLGLGSLHYNRLLLTQAREFFTKASDLVSKGPRDAATSVVHAEANYCTGTIEMVEGNYQRGFELLEWRMLLPETAPPAYTAGLQLWSGEALRSKSLLIYHEQGLGDTIQFLRYLPLAQTTAGRITVVLQPALAKLLPSTETMEVITDVDLQLTSYEAHCPIMSLGHILHTKMATIPQQYQLNGLDLHGVPGSLELQCPKGKCKVGLSWAGNPEYKRDHARSLHFSSLETLLTQTHCRFYSFQLGAPAVQAQPYKERINVLPLTLSDLKATAILLKQLDLFITVDTSLAHLAGTLGVRTWLLLPYAPDWRWLLDMSATPWYSTLKLYRQPTPGEWQPVISDILTDLRLLHCR